MNTLRIVLWSLVVLFGAAFAYLYVNSQSANQSAGVEDIRLGGPFSLIRHDGTPITEKAFEGRAHAIFFGFTNCPEICPTTLFEAAGWMRELGDQSNNVDFYFFTVDPQRDTPEILSDYVGAFDDRFTGVTGEPDEVNKTLKSYRVYSQRVELEEGDYTMDHSAFVMLFRPDGSFQGTISYGEASETALQKLQRLVNISS